MCEILTQIKNLLSQPSDARNLFLFFLLNFTFAFIELSLGYYSNSLSLQSDAFHMFNDSIATLSAVIAILINQWPKSKSRNRNFPFGYKRVEVLLAFLNCLFLNLIALNIFKKAVFRLVEPESVKQDHLLLVSVAGFFVNLVGVFVFMQAHFKTEKNKQNSKTKSESHHVLLSSVYFHTIADTLGSLVVIISGRLDHWYGWSRADPICSIFLAFTIIWSVKDVFKQTCHQLLQSSSNALLIKSTICRNQAMKSLKIKGLKNCRPTELWSLCEDCHFGIVVCCVDSDICMPQIDFLRIETEHIFGKRGIEVRVVFTLEERVPRE